MIRYKMTKKYAFLSMCLCLGFGLCSLPDHLQADMLKTPVVSSKLKSETPWWTIHVLLFKQAQPADLVGHGQPILRDEAPTLAIPANHVPVPIEPAWEARCAQLKKAGYGECWVLAWQQPMAAPFVPQPLIDPCEEEAGDDTPDALNETMPTEETQGMTPQAEQEEEHDINSEETTATPKCELRPHPIFQGQLTLSMTPRKAPRIALKLYASHSEGGEPKIAWRTAHTLKMGRLHYLDHAQLGAIIQVTPSLEPPFIDDDSPEE